MIRPEPRLRDRRIARVYALPLLVAALLVAPGRAPAEPQAKPKPAAKGAAKAEAAPAAAPAVAVDAAMLGAFKARSIGPAIMGGRVSAIAVEPDNPDTFYVGLATGGVLKTANAGGSFSSLFDKESVASIGAVALAPSDSTVVWVGTGEANDRNSSGWGNGVYRSTDSGGTWAHAGLLESRAIARIAVHPQKPETAWVCATGNLWAAGGDRGVYKTTDAGKTWALVLAAPKPDDAKMGCGDLVLDLASPDTLWAALYARQRTPWSFTYGASHTGGRDVGGIYKSTDGGATWAKKTKGLPSLTGRIGLDVYRKDPKVVYAVVQSDEGGMSSIDEPKSRSGGVFRSEDGGESFTRMSPLNPRSFYFSQIRVDPIHDKRVYVLGYMLHASDDGGKSWREDLFEKVHADCHDLVVVPSLVPPKPPKADPKSDEPPRPPITRRLLLGTDGGVYQSYEAGKNWAHLDRFAGGQFYRIGLDDSKPYRICGGLQDNLNWVGPSRTYSKDGITNADWTNIRGGDGFYCVFDPHDANVVYAESQEGELHRFDLRTGETKRLRPEPTEGQPRFRFHWNSPLLGSRHEKGALYLAGNRVFKLAEKAEKWRLISPDLSMNDPQKTTATGSGAENYGVIYTLAESPLKAGLLWAGTDDGKLWLTENDGETWTDLTANLPAAVKGQWMNRVEASAHDAKTAYLAVDAHRSGDLKPYAYKTTDSGKSWQSVVGDLSPAAPVRLVREDPKNPSLLWAGTEAGLFVTLDGGKSWLAAGKLPTVAVDDLAFHPRDGDLVVATHGRSLFVLDDVTALQAAKPETLAKDLVLFPPRPAFGRYLLDGWEDSNGKAVFRGQNPPEGALLTIWVKERTGEEVKVSIANADGQPVANLKVPGVPGFHRVSWDLRPTKDVLTEYGGLGARKLVAPGTYTVTASYAKGRESFKEKQKLVVEIAEGIEPR